MKKFNYLLMAALLCIVPALQSCDDDDDGYYVVCPPSTSWDWGTISATGGGSYYIEGDNYGTLVPAAALSWFHPVDGQRVIAFFNPLVTLQDALQVDINGIQEVLTKSVEELDESNAEEYGNDPIRIYQGDMWLGGEFLNVIFEQNLPSHEPHRISLVRNVSTSTAEEEGDTESLLDEEGYVNLELRYNTYNDFTGKYGWGFVSYNLKDFYEMPEYASGEMKGFKVQIHSDENGEGVIVRLSFKNPVGVPEKAARVHDISSFSLR